MSSENPDPKYEILSEVHPRYPKLRRIRAVRSFKTVREGDLGGWIERAGNLSHEGYCWVYDEARVTGNAEVSGSARVDENAVVECSAQVYGHATVTGRAEISGDARVSGVAVIGTDAQVREHANVHGSARVLGSAEVRGRARVYGHATVYSRAVVHGDAEVFDGACVTGEASVFGRARIRGEARISGGFALGEVGGVPTEESLVVQTQLALVDGVVHAYKRVQSTDNPDGFRSLRDPQFIYRIGEETVAGDADEDPGRSCGPGLHVGPAFYWADGDALIMVAVRWEDIVAIQAGKIRCRRLRVVRRVNLH